MDDYLNIYEYVSDEKQEYSTATNISKEEHEMPGGLGYWNHLHVVQAGSTALYTGCQEFQTMPF